MPDHPEQPKKIEDNLETDRAIEHREIDPQELVYRGGYQGNPREIVENPAVSPQMINEPSDRRDDLMDEA